MYIILLVVRADLCVCAQNYTCIENTTNIRYRRAIPVLLISLYKFINIPIITIILYYAILYGVGMYVNQSVTRPGGREASNRKKTPFFPSSLNVFILHIIMKYCISRFRFSPTNVFGR